MVEYGAPEQLEVLFPEWLQQCDLVVWETNSAVELLDPDVVVFLDMEGTGLGKNPGLALIADLVVEAPVSCEPGEVLCDLVMELAGFPGIRAISTEFKCWLHTSEGPVLGSGIARLLKHIAVSGSISSGSRLAGISYRRAWTLLSRAETSLGARLVTRTRGGRESGGSRLTLLAQRLIREFEMMEAALRETLDKVEEK
jgi:molybdate transport system regulatory protein